MSFDTDARRRIKAQEVAALRSFASEGRDANFWISWLQDQGFCEYKLCLKVGGVVIPDSEVITSGIATHKEIEKAHDGLAEFVGSVGDAVAQSIGFGESVSMAETRISGGCLTGQVDGLILTTIDGISTAYLIDNKTPPKAHGEEPFFSDRRQSLGYAVAWGWANPFYLECGQIFAVVRDKYYVPKYDLRGGWIWKAQLTEQHTIDIDEAIDWVKFILCNPSAARDTPRKDTKCPTCGFGKEGKCDRYNKYLGL